MYSTDWKGKLILATDNVLEQYQETMYAFFQGTGEVYVGGIIFSVEGKWIVRIHFISKDNKTSSHYDKPDASCIHYLLTMKVLYCFYR